MSDSSTLLRSDFSLREVVDTRVLSEVGSPSPGVTRRMIERIGDEVARATSIVRYAPGSNFAEHRHELGEEFLVLAGVFADEYGRYPAGTYVRNPPGSAHSPRTDEGCLLFVKLRQMAPDDQTRVVVDTRGAAWRQGLVPGLQVLPLGGYQNESTALVRWAPGTVFQPHTHFGGEEILVLEGVFEDEYGRYPAGSWMRSPHGSRHAPFSREGALIWVKVGHLPIAAES